MFVFLRLLPSDLGISVLVEEFKAVLIITAQTDCDSAGSGVCPPPHTHTHTHSAATTRSFVHVKFAQN
jgi:hypothetical protein